MSTAEWRWFVNLDDGPTTRYCWVDRKVKRGDRITLKDSDEPNRLWTVTWVGEGQQIPPWTGRGWHVGGLP